MTLENITEQIFSLTDELEQLEPITPQAKNQFQQKISLDWTYHSNAIEGNRLTFGETKSFLFRGVTAEGKPFRHYIDIKGHSEAVKRVFEYSEDKTPLSEMLIRELHEVALVEPYRVSSQTLDGTPTTKLVELGKYKTQPNHVLTSTGMIHYYASPEETPAKMGELIDWYRLKKEKGKLSPLLLATGFHYKFVAIHPFDDGNGRVARLLMNYIFMEFDLPPVVIPVEKKEKYLTVLEKADSGDLEALTVLIGEELVNSLRLYVRVARGENIDEPEDLDKKLALLQSKLESKRTLPHTPQTQQLVRILKSFLYKLTEQLEKFGDFFSSVEWEFQGKTREVSGLFLYLMQISGEMEEIIELVVSDLKLEHKQGRGEFRFIINFLGLKPERMTDLRFTSVIIFSNSSFQVSPTLLLRESSSSNFSERGKWSKEPLVCEYPNDLEDNKVNEFLARITDFIYHEIDSRL